RLAEPDAAAIGDAVRRRPLVVALNKVDKVAKPDLLPLMSAWHEWAAVQDADIIPISAATGDGVEALLAAVARRLPESPALFPDDVLTDRADRFLAAELIREQLFLQLGKELPYAAAIVIESFEERADRNDVVIGAIVVVERDSQKAIVVGKGGARIKQIGIAGRQAVAELLGCPVHLTLHVKVMPDWSDADRRLRELGYAPGGRS
ncbi:MAG: GTPase Era, partial [Myxococcales bacterium]|nr:GTPase Era [Myxococcales bacterium]